MEDGKSQEGNFAWFGVLKHGALVTDDQILDTIFHLLSSIFQ
jgi:hypothetical protein